MGSGTHATAYLKVKGSTQGGFQGDGAHAGHDRTLCLSVRFRGEVPHDVRGGKYSTTRHDPIAVVHEWGPSTVHFLTALWSNEVLDEVELEFVRPDGKGKEEVYGTFTLSKATVAYVELRLGEGRVEGEPGHLTEVGLLAEKLDFKLKGRGGQLTATYDRKKQS